MFHSHLFSDWTGTPFITSITRTSKVSCVFSRVLLSTVSTPKALSQLKSTSSFPFMGSVTCRVRIWTMGTFGGQSSPCHQLQTSQTWDFRWVETLSGGSTRLFSRPPSSRWHRFPLTGRLLNHSSSFFFTSLFFLCSSSSFFPFPSFSLLTLCFSFFLFPPLWWMFSNLRRSVSSTP